MKQSITISDLAAPSVKSIQIPDYERVMGCAMEDWLFLSAKDDDWGFFLKIACLIEITTKRAVALSLGADPDTSSASEIPFYVAMRLCRETGIVTEEGFHFADKVRHLRNDLVHTGRIGSFKMDDVEGDKLLSNYRKAVRKFIPDLPNSSKEDGLMVDGLIAYAFDICEALIIPNFPRVPRSRGKGQVIFSASGDGAPSG